MYKIVFLIIFLYISLVANSSPTYLTETEKKWIETHPIINVGGEMDWAPFDFVDSYGNYNGLAKDYLDNIAAIAGFKVKYHTGKTWSELLFSLKSGELDMLPALYKNKEREEYIEFTTSYLTLPEYIFTTNENSHLNSIEKLQGHTICQVKGYSVISWIKNNYPNINIIEKDSILTCLQSLKSAESIAFIGDNPSTNYNIKKNFITDIRLNSIVELSKPVKLYMGIKKEYQTLVSIINKVIKNDMQNNFSKISNKWMKVIENKNIILTNLEKKWMEENPINRIAVMEYWPHDDNGDSLHTELLKLINYYSGLHLVPIKFEGWKTGYEKAKNGSDLDGIMGLSWSKERELYFSYSPAYNFSPAYLVTKKNNFDIHSVKDLVNKTVLLQENEITNELLQEKSPSSKIINTDSLEMMYNRFSKDLEVDAMFSYFLNEVLIEEYDFKIVEELYDRYGEVSIGINKSNKILSDIINKAFKVIPKNELTFLRDKDWGGTKDNTKLSTKELKYIKNNKIIKVCTNARWEPIEFKKDGLMQGISIDILNIIKEKLEIEYDFIYTSSLLESQEFLKNKKCDILPSAIKTQDRLAYANFTKSYLDYKLAIITKDDQPLINNFESIISKSMSVEEGSELATKIQNTYPSISIKKTSSYLNSLESVIDNKAYFTLSALPIYSYFKSKYGLKDLEVAGTTDLEYNLSIAIVNDNELLLNILNKTLYSIPKSTFDVIEDKWSRSMIIKHTDWVLFSKIFAVVIIIIIAILLSNRKLNTMVQEKTKDISAQKEELLLLMTSLDKNVIYSKTDLKGKIIHVSDAFCKISGYKKEELIGRTHKIVRHPDMPDVVFKDIWNSLLREERYTIEIKNKKKGGSDYWVKAYLEPEYNSNNELIGYSSLMQDITDKKAIENLSKNLENIVNERTNELKIAKKEVELIHKRTQDSIEYASLIQHSLIPKNDIFRKYFQEYFTIWHPKDVVGGDIYLFEELRSEDECLIMVIDCTGHGVPGAFVTMLVKAIERQIVATIKHNKDEIVSPGKLLGIFNKSMKHLLRQEDEHSVSNAGFDGGILYYNKKDNIIKFSGAETPLFYTDENNILHTIKGNRHSIGYKKCDSNFEFKEHHINVKKGMNFYLATDGYFDQNGGDKGFPFGKKRFINIINEYKNESCADQQEILLDELDLYQNEEDRNDDVTLIGFKI